METLHYTPPPTIRELIKHYLPGQLFYDFVVGPYGSGKTTGIFFKLAYMAQLQAPGPDGIRRTRAVVVRNTAPQLRDTTLKSWFTWFKDGQAGTWKATNKDFILKFGDVECEVLFRPLDTPDDVAKVLSLEITWAILDEFVEIPRAIVDGLSARLGRYPAAKDGGATNYGLWGASNPSVEDNWWYEYLHNPGDPECLPENGRYFLQPSGFSPEAENIENLPKDYYKNQAKGKSDTWVKQYLCSDWGYSVAGKPVVQSFKAETHVSKKPLLYNPGLKLVGGFDPGIGGTAMVFGQEDLDGRLVVLGELVSQGKGTSRFIQEDVRPYLRRNFPDLDPTNFVIAPDPAAGNRTATDEKTVVDIIKKYFNVSIESNNRLPLRLDAIEHYTSRLTPIGPALAIDEKACPHLIRALKGGWRYTLDKKELIRGSEPEKNASSHVADGFAYLARYFHRSSARNERYLAGGAKPFTPPRRFGGNMYHVR